MNKKIITEHWRVSNQTLEHVELSTGNIITVFIKDGYTIIFSSLEDFIEYECNGMSDINRIYCDETNLSEIYGKYNSFSEIKLFNENSENSGKIYINSSIR